MSVISGVSIGLNTAPQRVDWQTLDAVWARAGDYDVLDSMWMNDHLTDPTRESGGSSLESMTAMATLVHRVPGRWLGHGVLSATFRHPSVLAKQAAVMDHATGGRFILGLGAGWHPGEHLPFGIPFPPMPERFDRFESAVETIRALLARSTVAPGGVSRPDPFYPLQGATCEPPPLTPGGPPIWLGGQKRRGIALAARVAQGWMLPAVVPGTAVDLDYFKGRRDAILTELAAIPGRAAGEFGFGAKLLAGLEHGSGRAVVSQAIDYVRAGATHVLFSVEASLGPSEVDRVVTQVVRPLRDAIS